MLTEQKVRILLQNMY